MSGERASGPDEHGAVVTTVPAMLAGVRLDRAVSLLTGMSRAAAAELIAHGGVRVDGRPETRRSSLLGIGAALEIAAREAGASTPEPDPGVEFGVVLEDDDVVVVDKPWDLVVHPGAGRRSGTLVAGILARYPEIGELGTLDGAEPDRPGIVHRLDRGTSGLLVVARSPRAFASLRAQMKKHSAGRRYVALVHGRVEAERGLIDAPLGRSGRRPTAMTVSASGREARTAYEVVAHVERPIPSTLVVVSLETGRTHQVRVHMAAIGHPVVGDSRYGREGAPVRVLPAGRFFLHAFELSFEHPADGRVVTCRAPLAPDLAALVGELPELP